MAIIATHIPSPEFPRFIDPGQPFCWKSPTDWQESNGLSMTNFTIFQRRDNPLPTSTSRACRRPRNSPEFTELLRKRNITMPSEPARPRDHQNPVCVLTIAGSDSGGGAGIQADLKTFAAHGVHGLSALTAVTAQNTREVRSVHQVPVREIRRQIEAVFDDFPVAAVKIGMLGNAATVRAVAAALARAENCHVVLDPVMVASSGARLLADDAIHALRTRLLPLATVVTPNLPEAECLLERRVAGVRGMQAAADELLALGCKAVLLKGGHLKRGPVVDLLLHHGGVLRFSHPRLPLRAHGTGCTLASALAARLALGAALPDAARGAVDYVHGALLHGFRAGAARVTILNHAWQKPPRGSATKKA